MSVSLENFLAGKPLNDQMERLMRGDDGEEIAVVESQPMLSNRLDRTPINDHDREYIRQLLTHPGWQVLLKLLDTELQSQEDAARAASLIDPLLHRDEIANAWANVAADRRARNRIAELAESEVTKLNAAKKKKKWRDGQLKTRTEKN